MPIDRKYWDAAIKEVFTPVATQQNNAENNLAQYLLLHTASDKAITNTVGNLSSNGPTVAAGATTEHHGLLGKVFDLLDVPGEVARTLIHDTVGNFEEGLSQGENPIQAGIDTIKQTPKSSLKNVGGNLIRGLTDSAGITTDMLGISHMPGIGDKINELENKGWQTSNKLAPRTFGQDVLRELGVKNKAALIGGGLAYDVASDPLTYIPGVDIFSIGRKAKLAAQGMRDGANLAEETLATRAAASGNGEALVKPTSPEIKQTPVADLATGPTLARPKSILPDLPESIIPQRVIEPLGQSISQSPEDIVAMKALKRSDDAKRAANVRWGKPVDWHDIPDAMSQEERAAFADKMRQGKMAAKGVVADGKGNISLQAGNNVLRDIAEGTVPRWGPKIDPVDHPELVSSINSALSDVLGNATRETAGELLPEAQVKLFNQLSKDAKAALGKGSTPEKAHNLSIRMLKTAEDSLISKGVQPAFFNGMRVRLSDVLAEVGPLKLNNSNIQPLLRAFATGDTKVIKDPQLAGAVNTALARRSLTMADLLGKLTSKAEDLKNSVTSDLVSNPVAQKRLAEQAREAATHAGATVSEGKAVRDYIQSFLGRDNAPVDEVMSKLTPELMREMAEGAASSEARTRLNAAILNTIGSTPEQLAKDVTGNKAVDATMTRLSTWFGRQREMKQVSDDYYGVAEQVATARGTWLNNIAKTHTKEQIFNAFNLAQLGALREGEFVATTAADDATMQLAHTFHDYMKDLLGATGLEKAMQENGSVAIRSQMVMEDVNKMLKATAGKNAFQFEKTSRKTLQFAGAKGEAITRNYSKGTDWVKSWEVADAVNKHPLRLIQDIEVSMSKVAAQYRTFDDFAMTFGAKPGMRHFNPNVHTKGVAGLERIADYKFHPEIADAFSRLVNDLGTGPWVPSNKAIQFFATGTRKWKTSVTIYRPIHHIRNLIGDSFNMWLAGIDNPKVFTKSMDILASQKARYSEVLKQGDYDRLTQLIGHDALQSAEQDNKVGKVITNIRGHKITAEQYYAAAFNRGLLRDYNKIEDLFGQTPLGDLTGSTPEKVSLLKMKPFGGRVHNAAAKLSEHREHFVRMAHFNGAVEKGLKKLGRQPNEAEMKKIFDEAAHRVRRYHPDGTDLTQFEQKLRLVIPFYSWTRKEIPLLVQAMFERPGKIVAYPRLQYNIQGAAGIQQNENGMLDPFPNDQLFPDWLRAGGIGPIGDPQSDNPFAQFFGKFGTANTTPNGSREGDIIINPSNPFNDTVSQLFGLEGGQSMARNILNMSNPAINIPVQLATNQTFSGAPITKDQGGKGIIDYLLSQAPYSADGMRLSGAKNKDGTDQGAGLGQNWLNFLLGTGIKGTGPYEKQAQFEAKDRARNASK